MVIRRLISRGESSTTLCLPAGTSHSCAATLPPSLPYRPSYLFIPTLALFLFPTLLLCHSCSIQSHSFLHSPRIQSPNITALARIDWNPEPTRNRSDISADQHHQSFSPLRPNSTSPQTPDTHLKGKTRGGLRSNSPPRHSPKVATTLTKNLGEAHTIEIWMTKHHQDCSLPLPSMTLSHPLHIRSSVH
jgi:hypothetical protein